MLTSKAAAEAAWDTVTPGAAVKAFEEGRKLRLQTRLDEFEPQWVYVTHWSDFPQPLTCARYQVAKRPRYRPLAPHGHHWEGDKLIADCGCVSTSVQVWLVERALEALRAGAVPAKDQVKVEIFVEVEEIPG